MCDSPSSTPQSSLLLLPCRLRQQILTSGIDNDVGLSLIQMLQDSRPVTGDNEEGVPEVGSCCRIGEGARREARRVVLTAVC